MVKSLRIHYDSELLRLPNDVYQVSEAAYELVKNDVEVIEQNYVEPEVVPALVTDKEPHDDNIG